LLKERTVESEYYRRGFQGQEHDDEVKGEGNSVNYRYRMHDPRVGRFFAVDPLFRDYPHYTPYSFSGNKLIAWRELEGLEEYFTNDFNPGIVFWNLGGRKYDNSHGGAPQLMSLTTNSQGHRQAIIRPLIETDATNVGDVARTMVTSVTNVQTTIVDADGPAIGSEPWDVIRQTAGGGQASNMVGVNLWPANSISTNANGSAIVGAAETFNLVIPSGAGNPDATGATYAMSLDFNSAPGVNLQLTDNTGAIIYNGPGGAAAMIVALNPNTTSITATITNVGAANANFTMEASIPGTTNNPRSISGSSSAGLDINNTNPSNPNTVVTNTSVTVLRPLAGSSSSNPLNEISE